MQNVALLRGINVGGRTIPVAELKVVFSEMDLDNVKTVLQTGNVIFSSDRSLSSLKQLIEAALSERFNYPAHVHVHRMVQLRQIVEASPFEGTDSRTHSYVVFFVDGLEQKLMAEAKDLDSKVESIEVGDGVVYWQVVKGNTLQSSFAKYLTKARYRGFHTNRNINTLRKILG